MSLSVHVEKAFDDFSLKVDLEVEEGIIGLLGYSGSGKTMTLKMIAGIVKPDRGRIVLNDKVLFDSERKINLKPQQRNVGLMFQSYALFNHMSVYDNIAIGLKGSKKEKEMRIMPYLKLLQLEELRNRKPRMLSGGQKQRVALARLLAQKPDLIMLDEPFSALDNHLKFILEEDFKKALRAFEKTVLYISHNRQEVYKYCDQTAIMADGSIKEIKDTFELFRNCETVAGAKLTGCRNIVKCEWINEEELWIESWQLRIRGPLKKRDFQYVGLRDNQFEFVKALEGENIIRAQVGEVFKMPDKVKIECLAGNEKIILTCSQREYKKVKTLLDKKEIGIQIEPDELLYLKKM